MKRAATACFGGDSSQFTPNNLFAAAGEGIWDNGASCGREYLVRCLSSAVPGACTDGDPTIQVTVVDQADGLVNSLPSAFGTTLVLSRTAFAMIANLSSSEINIEFTEYFSTFPFASPSFYFVVVVVLLDWRPRSGLGLSLD